MSVDEKRKGMLLVISGPSGTGKGTLCERLFEDDPSLTFSVSYTTRARRDNEIDHVHYHFTDKKTFDKMAEAGAFLERATVHGHDYGTPRAPVDEAIAQGRNIVLDIDPQGARRVMAAMPECVTVFIMPPSFAALKVRLHTRNTDDPAEIEKRLRNARGEVEQAYLYQYAVVNDDLELALSQLRAIVAAEKQKTTRYLPKVLDE